MVKIGYYDLPAKWSNADAKLQPNAQKPTKRSLSCDTPLRKGFGLMSGAATAATMLPTSPDSGLPLVGVGLDGVLYEDFAGGAWKGWASVLKIPEGEQTQ
jgi:hypothetical protein